MKEQLGVSALRDTLLVSGEAAFAHTDGSPPPRHHGQVEQHSDIQHVHGMYERGRRRGWYKKGGRMPSAYRGRLYVVRNWRANRLRPPPLGYYWLRSDNGDFLLVAVSSGIIAGIVANAASH